jgi:hypothetical protein
VNFPVGSSSPKATRQIRNIKGKNHEKTRARIRVVTYYFRSFCRRLWSAAVEVCVYCRNYDKQQRIGADLGIGLGVVDVVKTRATRKSYRAGPWDKIGCF